MVIEPSTPRLPRGRHRLPREEVEQAQRLRLLVGMAEAMNEKGYAGTPVADVLARAGVSRETFYRLYTSKLDCFLDAFDLVADALSERLVTVDAPGTPIERFDRALAAYLDTLANAPAYARLFLVEVHAAGPEALARRIALQARLVDGMARLFGSTTAEDRFAWEVLVAAISAMVTGPIVTGDVDAIRRLHGPLVDHVRRVLGDAIA